MMLIAVAATGGIGGVASGGTTGIVIVVSTLLRDGFGCSTLLSRSLKAFRAICLKQNKTGITKLITFNLFNKYTFQ